MGLGPGHAYNVLFSVMLVPVQILEMSAGNSPIRGTGMVLNGAKVVPVGVHGDGDGMHAPVPTPHGDPISKAHILARSNNCGI